MSDPTIDEALALLDELRTRRNLNGHDPDAPWQPPTPIVDWPAAYGLGEDPARWLAEPLLPDAGSVAIFAKGGTGKSLLALWLAADLATRPEVPVEVLYLDYEMTLRTVVERLEDMGYDDPGRLGRLHYCSLPSLAPLDTAEGGRAVVGMAQHLGVALVVIDTFGRAVNGEEDSADTVRAWYRWTGQLLKTAGIGFLRIDHAGKDLTRGQRGTSAKNDDVDLVWEMTARDGGEYLLRATKRRVDWIAERVVLRQTNENGVLAYRWDDDGVTYLAGTKAVAEQLDELGAPLDITKRAAQALLTENGCGRRANIVADALRYRRGPTARNHLDGSDANLFGTDTGTKAKPLEEPPRDHAEPPLDANRRVGGVYVVDPHAERVPLLFDDIEVEP